jgi:hypothetical protein
MRKFILLAILVVALSLVVPLSAGAVSDPVSVNSSLLYMDFPVGGTAVLSVTITNTSGSDLPINISNWYDYTSPSEGYEWIDPSWVTAIAPVSQLLIAGGQMVANVQYTVPDSAADIRYQTWIRVDAGGWQKPVVVIIRKGSAIPTYDYSVGPSYYKLLVSGFPASIVVDDEENKEAPPVSVTSRCSATTFFYATAEDPQQEIAISADSPIAHTEDEIGTVYKPVTNKTAEEWFSTAYVLDNPLRVGPYATGYVTWSLSIPDSVKNGYYALATRILPAESSGGMTTNYLIWMLVKVQREQAQPLHFQYTYIVLGSCLGLLAVAGGLIYWLKLRKPRVYVAANNGGAKRSRHTAK